MIRGSMILRDIAIITVLIGALLVYAASRPGVIRIERSALIDARPEAIYPLIADFHNWPTWAPQDREEPGMKRTYSGAASGAGAVSDWNGKGSSGAGRLTITDASANVAVRVRAEWIRPFHTVNINEFALRPEAGETRVTWTMTGPNLFPMKLMGIFTNMDRMMGRHFEAGLADLRRAAERATE